LWLCWKQLARTYFIVINCIMRSQCRRRCCRRPSCLYGLWISDLIESAWFFDKAQTGSWENRMG
jgi:hypothetical protein